MNGFINIGNNCYLNSILQVLLNMNIFNKCIKNITAGKKDNFSQHYLQLHNINNSMIFKRELAKKNELFNNFNQQDAHDALKVLLEIFHEEYKGHYFDSINIYENKIYNSKQLDLYVKHYVKTFINKFGYSFINYIFEGYYLNRLHCTYCKYTKISSIEPFNDICLSFPNEGNFISLNSQNEYYLNDLVMNNFQEEYINGVSCDKCKNKTEYKKKTNILIYPNVLILTIKRFNNNLNKNNSFILFNETMIFNNLTYKLKFIINHIGHSGSHGHYNIIKIKEQEWTVYDDQHIYKINPFNRSNNCYIFLYEIFKGQ